MKLRRMNSLSLFRALPYNVSAPGIGLSFVRAALFSNASTANVVDGKYALTYDLNNDKLKSYEENGFKSWVYLCPETNNDVGFENGFQSRKTSLQSVHFPVSPSEMAIVDKNSTPWQRMLIYKKFEKAFEDLPQPVVVSCKSSTRASALVAAYKGVTEGISPNGIMQWAQQNKLVYANNPKMTEFVTEIIENLHGKNKLVFRQFFEPVSSTYTYLLADDKTKEAILIDPVLETVERDLQQISDLGLKLKYCVNTHVHADHITGSGAIKKKLPEVQSVIGAKSGAKADIKWKEFDFLQFGTRKIYAVSTPGHTNGCTSLVLDDLSKVFTGDAMFIRGCGRTDFQEGSPETLYSSVHDKLFKWLPDDCALYPGHDYKGLAVSSIGEEKRLNPRLTKTKEQFVEIMKNLNLPPPKKINEAVPANLVCGIQ